MSLLNATNLAQSYGDYTVFSNITVEIPHQARIALVGPNGAGKTTLLSVLLGESTPSSGEVQTMRNLRMGFLPQRPELHGGHSLYQEVLGAFDELRQREHELTNLEHQLAQAVCCPAENATGGYKNNLRRMVDTPIRNGSKRY
ncbi:MAG UNVERIFIED_CONTAM: ATP-binding cassette domain-containing protein [Anaerolineae bacterium]|jgi:ATP-binding cassette subfamily F protein 3